jgi:4,5-dihydroxyphthalate decarboxylase
VPIRLPDGVRIRYVDSEKMLSQLLESGEVEAAFLHQVPECFSSGSPKVRRMFPDYREKEIEYYRRTGVHPIMHCVVVRKDVYQRRPWVLQNLYKSLREARRRTLEALADIGAYSAMIPFLPAVMDDTRAVFGNDFWPYGVKDNLPTLEKLVRYAYHQGLAPRVLNTETLFHESVSDL